MKINGILELYGRRGKGKTNELYINSCQNEKRISQARIREDKMNLHRMRDRVIDQYDKSLKQRISTHRGPKI